MTIALIFMSIITPILCFVAFMSGIRVGRENLIEDKPKAKKLKPIKKQETEEERISRIRHENIENFGTNKPQQEVK